MPVYRVWIILLVTMFFSSFAEVFSQTLPVGLPVLEDTYRREQLLGKSDSLISFTIRPLFTGNEYPAGTMEWRDSMALKRPFFKFKNRFNWAGDQGSIELLPFNYQYQANSELPYNWNDGAMIPSRGNQSQMSLGVFAKYGPLSIQLKPEYIHADNLVFEGFPAEQYDVVWAKYFDSYYNVSEITERFGEDVYSKLFWGQSSIRLTFDPVSIGLSNENLWWGPGNRSSLLMSNNAPGFKHITVNTARPVQTKFGSFEAQLIAGRLENSGILPREVNRAYEGRTLYIPKRTDWRYLSGFVMTYNPKWVPGLFIGASRASQMYHQDAGTSPADFIPLLKPFENKTAAEKRDRYSTLFFRWALKESNAEVYAEYGYQGKKTFVHLREEPEIGAAYLFGLRKIIPWHKRSGQYLQLSFELTQLQQPSVPQYGGWYTSSTIRQGYTHNGQVLGAGIGPGSNLQSLSISWYKGLKRIGLQGERYDHNNDFYYQMYNNPIDVRKHYIDMSASAFLDWDYRNLVFSAKGSMIRSLNYQYVLYNRPPDYFITGWDRINYQLNVGLMYRF